MEALIGDNPQFANLPAINLWKLTHVRNVWHDVRTMNIPCSNASRQFGIPSLSLNYPFIRSPSSSLTKIQPTTSPMFISDSSCQVPGLAIERPHRELESKSGVGIFLASDRMLTTRVLQRAILPTRRSIHSVSAQRLMAAGVTCQDCHSQR